MKSTIFLLLTSLFFTAGGCAKDDLNELPPATQTGENTFGCKINGVVYKCSGLSEILAVSGITYYSGNNYAHITAIIYKPEKRIFFDFDFDFKTGIYRNGLKVNTGTVILGSDSFVMITKYSDNIISGKFQMDVEFDDGEVWHITEGRFDIKRNN